MEGWYRAISTFSFEWTDTRGSDFAGLRPDAATSRPRLSDMIVIFTLYWLLAYVIMVAQG